MRTLILSLAMLAVPAAASAQTCPYGLTAVDGAHCCWPGQTFAADRGLCVGVPQCPPGLAAYGEACVAASAQAQPQPPQLPPQPDPQADEAMPPPPPPPPPGAYQALPPQPMQLKPAMPVPPQVFGRAVRFEAKDPARAFTVTLEDGQSCKTPCDLTVQPGKQKVKVEGDARFQQKMDFSAPAGVVQIEKRGAGGLALGIVSLSLGIPTAVLGGLYGLVSLVANNSYSSSPYNRNAMYTGFGIMALGATVAAAGGAVGFNLAGHNRAAFAPHAEAEPKAPPVQMLSLGVVPTTGGAMAGATFAF